MDSQSGTACPERLQSGIHATFSSVINSSCALMLKLSHLTAVATKYGIAACLVPSSQATSVGKRLKGSRLCICILPKSKELSTYRKEIPCSCPCFWQEDAHHRDVHTILGRMLQVRLSQRYRFSCSGSRFSSEHRAHAGQMTYMYFRQWVSHGAWSSKTLILFPVLKRPKFLPHNLTPV